MKAYSYDGDEQRQVLYARRRRKLEKLRNDNVAALEKFLAELKARKEPIPYKGAGRGRTDDGASERSRSLTDPSAGRPSRRLVLLAVGQW